MKINRPIWTFICGKAGYGKTTLAKQIIKHLEPDRTYILDYTGVDYREFEDKCWYFQPTKGTLGEIEDFIEIVMQIGNVTVVMDEADNYFSVDSPVLRRFVTIARNRGIGAVIIGKRPKAILPIYRTRFNQLVIFRTELQEDKKYLKDWVGIEKHDLRRLSSLGIGECLVYADDKIEWDRVEI